MRLFITEYATELPEVPVAVVDLLAAVPSLLFGLWGFLFLSDYIVPVSRWLTDHLGFIPFFETETGAILFARVAYLMTTPPLVVFMILIAQYGSQLLPAWY